jgi:hypothetical protein
MYILPLGVQYYISMVTAHLYAPESTLALHIHTTSTVAHCDDIVDEASITKRTSTNVLRAGYCRPSKLTLLQLQTLHQ